MVLSVIVYSNAWPANACFNISSTVASLTIKVTGFVSFKNRHIIEKSIARLFLDLRKQFLQRNILNVDGYSLLRVAFALACKQKANKITPVSLIVLINSLVADSRSFSSRRSIERQNLPLRLSQRRKIPEKIHNLDSKLGESDEFNHGLE